LHHFITESPWEAKETAKTRNHFESLVRASIILIIDDTGDKKQGHTTDYVKRQYIWKLRQLKME